MVPSVVGGADQVVLLVLDGLGWEQFQARTEVVPCLAGMEGRAITSVAPSTTATALTSIATGSPPGEHGVIGYRIAVDGEVLNVLRWTTARGDARHGIHPSDIRPDRAVRVAAAARSSCGPSSSTRGFTEAHLRTSASSATG